MRADRLCERQREVDVDLAEEEHRARVAMQYQRVLAAPADAAARGELGFEHGRRVGERAVSERPDVSGQLLGQAREPRAQHLVIVAAPCIQRDVGAHRLGEPAPLDGLPALAARRRQVVHARRDHAYRPGHQLDRTRALQAVPRHVGHAAVEACGQPVRQAGFGGHEVDIGHADLRKSQCRRALAQLF